MKRWVMVFGTVILLVTVIYADDFRYQNVVDVRRTGEHKTFVLDSTGSPHIIYRDRPHAQIKHAYKEGGCKWITSSIPTPEEGYVYSAAMDDSGRLHFVFVGIGGDNRLYYNVRKENWQAYPVADSCGSRTSLLIDSNYDPHIVYYLVLGVDRYLMHAYRDGPTFQYDSLGPGLNPSAALNSADRVHIAYEDPYKWELRYMVVDSVDIIIGPGALPSLSVDSEGRPHVSCIDLGGPALVLRYYYWDGSDWQTQVVDTVGFTGLNDIEVNSVDEPNIMYTADRALKYAVLSGIWEIQQIDTITTSFPYLKLNKLDNPHVCYDTGTYHHLMYAWLPDSEYVKICVDPDSLSFVYGFSETKASAEDGNLSGCELSAIPQGWMEAVELPISVPCSLSALRFYPCDPYGEHPDLYWKVWEDDGGQPGNVRAEGTISPPFYDTVVEIPIDPNIPLDPGVIYVGWKQQGAYDYFNGYDSSLEEATNWVYDGDMKFWTRELYIPGNLMIRAQIFISNPYPVDTVTIMNDGYMIDLQVDSVTYGVSWIESIHPSPPYLLSHDSTEYVEVDINALGLTTGVYTDIIEIYSDDPHAPQYYLPVELKVDPDLIGVEEEASVPISPRGSTLLLIGPNPARETVTIPYFVAREGDVSLRIYNPMGQLVRTLVDGKRVPGYYQSSWGGRDDTGKRVSTGVYFCMFKVEGLAQTRKIIFLK